MWLKTLNSRFQCICKTILHSHCWLAAASRHHGCLDSARLIQVLTIECLTVYLHVVQHWYINIMDCSFKLPVLNCFDIACFQKRAGNFNRLKLFHISSRMSSLIVDSKCCPCVSQCRSIPGVVLQKTCSVGPFLAHKQENFLLDVDSMGIKLSSNIAHNSCEYVVSRCAVFVALLVALLKVCDYNRNSVRLPQQRCNGACVRVSMH